jgi:hypothetical protein
MLGSAAPPVLPVIPSAGVLASINLQAESKVATALTANGAACERAAVKAFRMKTVQAIVTLFTCALVLAHGDAPTGQESLDSSDCFSNSSGLGDSSAPTFVLSGALLVARE